MFKKLLFIIIISAISFSSYQAYAGSAAFFYEEGIRAAKSGNLDKAFMSFRALIREHPKSKLKEKALFGLGEYYFHIVDYYDASLMFTRLINDYPNSKSRIFCLAYLLEIAKKQQNQDLIEKLEKHILTFQQHSFIFRDYKEYVYSSPFSKKYKAVYFIDKIEFYVDGELFTTIRY